MGADVYLDFPVNQSCKLHLTLARMQHRTITFSCMKHQTILLSQTLTATMSADVAKSLVFTSIARSYKTIIPLKITNSTSLDSCDQKITSSTKLQMITVFYFSGFFNFFLSNLAQLAIKNPDQTSKIYTDLLNQETIWSQI